MKRTYKYRLYPNKSQEETLRGTLETCRLVYNTALTQRCWYYQETRRGINYNQQALELKEAREGDEYLSCVHSQVLQDVLRRADKSFKNFFRRVNEKKKGKNIEVGYPRYKGKNRYHSFTYPQSGFEVIENSNKPKHAKLKLSKIGNVSIRYHRLIPREAEIKTLAIIRKMGKWYACFSLELPEVPTRECFTNPVGIDVGLEKLATLDNGDNISNEGFLREAETKLKRAQKLLSRNKGGKKGERKSNNYKRGARKVAILHERVASRRKDYLHKVSREIVDKYDLVLLEDLRIRNMLKNHHLAKSIADASWGTFADYLAYKEEESGGLVVRVDPKGTSQVCSNPDCLERVPKTLATRVHRCPYCGLTIDRDENAAITIRRLGTNRIACGELGDLAVFGSAGVTGSVNQEAPSVR